MAIKKKKTRAKVTRRKYSKNKISRGRGRPKKYTDLDSFSERSIQYFLHQYYKETSSFMCRNKYLYTWEVDWWHINNLSYHCEHEIKVSRSDWNKEFKEKPQKHEFLLETMQCGGDNLSEELFCPNKFVMTCPEDLIQPEEVEEMMPFASLVWVTNKGTVKKKIDKYIHKKKQDMNEVLLKKFYSVCSSHEYNLYMALKNYNKIKERASKEDLEELLLTIFKETRI